MEIINYNGWKNSLYLSNSLIDLIITTDVGPRIIRLGYKGKRNIFKEYKDMLGKVGGDAWRIYGGHRLWHAPETYPRTYFPDNSIIKVEQHNDVIRLISPTELTTGIIKEIDIQLFPDSPKIKVTHRFHNTNLWRVELSLWAISCMAPDGEAIIPLPIRTTAFDQNNPGPTNSITLWPYTDMADQRFTWGTQYIIVKQDPKNGKHLKIGVKVPDGWISYASNDYLFIKRFSYCGSENYPDIGSNVEVFTNDDMLELETLSPLESLSPNSTMEYVEYWFLFNEVPFPKNEEDIGRDVLPRVRTTTIQELFKENQ